MLFYYAKNEVINIKKFEKYITSLEEENEILKAENAELHSQVDFINTLPEDRLDNLVLLAKEMEEIKQMYLNSINEANEAKKHYEEAYDGAILLKRELVDGLMRKIGN